MFKVESGSSSALQFHDLKKLDSQVELNELSK